MRSLVAVAGRYRDLKELLVALECLIAGNLLLTLSLSPSLSQGMANKEGLAVAILAFIPRNVLFSHM
jgi:hypothetical protein